MYYIVKTKSGKHHVSKNKIVVTGAKILMVTNNNRMANEIINHLNTKPQPI